VWLALRAPALTNDAGMLALWEDENDCHIFIYLEEEL
jgi:hypothetical protein